MQPIDVRRINILWPDAVSSVRPIIVLLWAIMQRYPELHPQILRKMK